MPDSYVKQNFCPIRMLGNKSDIYLDISSITNVSSIRIYIVTTMGYPTQFSISGTLTKGDMQYHTSIFYDESNFDWSKIEFKYQDEPISFHLLYRSLCMVNLTLSAVHMTIVIISHLVEKVPLQELLSATKFSVRLV